MAVYHMDLPLPVGWVGEIQQTSEEAAFTAGENINSIPGQPTIRFMPLDFVEIGGLSF